jgi:endo-1,4-beta-xylanase
MKQRAMFTIFALCLLAAGMMMAGCKNPAGSDPGNGDEPGKETGNGSLFVAVAGIELDGPSKGTVGINLTLKGKVTPPDAANQTIVWSVKSAGTTGAAISNGNTLSATGPGDVVVTATIANGKAAETPYTKDFPINITETFVPVTGITFTGPTSGTAGQPLILSGKVTPSDASDRTIVWSVVKEDPDETETETGAEIEISEDGDVLLLTTVPGDVMVTATIANGKAVGTPYTQNFPIAIKFVPVEKITDVPTRGAARIDLILRGKVTPDNAANQTIVWSVKSAGTTTGAEIEISENGDRLLTTGPGDVVVTATIADGKAVGDDYTQDFPIIISQTLVPVENITDVPTSWTMNPEEPLAFLALSGKIFPPEASDQKIVWTVKDLGGTKASIIEGYKLSTVSPGKVVVTATIANGKGIRVPYTQDFPIYIVKVFVPVGNITGVPTSGTAGQPLILSGKVTPDNATNRTIVWSVTDQGGTGAAISESGDMLSLSTTGKGTVKVTATIANGKAVDGETEDYTQDFPITIGFVPVTGITVVPGTMLTGSSSPLSGIIAPHNASFQGIVWTVADRNGTEASITNNTLAAGNTAGTVKVRATIANGKAVGEDYITPDDGLISIIIAASP